MVSDGQTGAARPGWVYLVGAGPGDPGLLTRRGAELLASADVIIYDGLASSVLLSLSSPTSTRIYAGKKGSALGAPRSQRTIESLAIEHASAGRSVVRLKGGDPFVFGRGAEECEALATAGIPFEIVPGVSSATAVPAYAGIPLTARDVASTVAFATGHEATGKGAAVDWSAIARADTVVLFMALATAEDCCARLIAAGRAGDTPAAAIHWGTTASQTTVVSTLAGLPAALAAAQLKPPALLVIGEVVQKRRRLSWYENRPLFGARVLVTRSADRAEPFVDAVTRLGGEALVAPLTEVVPPKPADRQGLVRGIEQLSDYGWLVFTSGNAVDRFFAELTERGLDARALATARLACVGTATAARLSHFGLRADVVPPHGDARQVARAVIDAAGPDLTGCRVLLPRAETGREEAATELRAAGAQVDVVIAYRLALTPPDRPEIASALDRLHRHEIHAIGFFAPSQVRALCQLLGSDAQRVLAKVPVLAAIGATTAAQLAGLGLANTVVSATPEAAALAQAIADALSSSSEGAHAVP